MPQSWNFPRTSECNPNTVVDTTGSPSASRGILFVFDIFGFWPQTLQGADILSTSDHQKPYQVFMPDWFEGNPADISWYPPDTEEKGKKLGNFFGTTGAPPKTVQRIPRVVKEIQGAHPEIKEWGIIGFCWGGKVNELHWSVSNNPQEQVLMRCVILI